MRHYDFLTGDAVRDARNVDVLLRAVERMYGRTKNLEEVLESAVDGALEVSGGQRGVLLLEDEPDLLTVRVARDREGNDLRDGIRYSGTVVDRVWRSRRAEVTRDTAETAGGSLSESQRTYGIRSVIAVPLPGSASPLGVLYVDSSTPAPAFTQGDRAVIESLAGLAGGAIERSHFERFRRSIEVAREIQRALAPGAVPAPPGVDVAFASRTAEETGGDYHDALPLADGSLCLVVGDVSGKGLGAALHMASVRATLRALLRTRTDPLSVIPELHAYACTEMRPGEFVTLALVHVDARGRSMRWVTAGQSLLHWRRDGGLAKLTATGPPLGAFEDARFSTGGPVDLGPGDAVVLYTDGMYEAFDAEGQMYEEDGFEASVAARAARGGSARELLAGLLADVRTHLDGSRPDDDATCIVLRVTRAADPT